MKIDIFKIKSDSPDRAVWILVYFGLLACFVMAGAISWSLVRIQTQRTRRDQIQKSRSEALAKANDLLERSSRFTQPILQGIGAKSIPPEMTWDKYAHADTHSQQWLPAEFLNLTQGDDQLAKAIESLDRFNHICLDFSDKLEMGREQRTKSRMLTRSAIGALQADMKITVGKLTLEKAIAIRDYRQLSGAKRANAAKEFLDSQTPDFHYQNQITELAELETLCEAIYGADKADLLAHLKDNQIAGCLTRLNQQIIASRFPQVRKRQIALMGEIEKEILGDGFRNDSAHQSLILGKRGLYNACTNWLDLKNERRQLEQSQRDHTDKFISARAGLIDQSNIYFRNSADLAAATVKRALVLVLTIVFVYSSILLVLAFKISKTILDQFSELRQQATELEQNSEQLQSTAEHLELLSLVAKYTDNAVAITDSTCTIEWVNEAFERITGFNWDESRGTSWIDRLNSPESESETIDAIRNSIANQAGIDVEIERKRKLGEVFWSSIEGRPILDNNGVAERYVWIEKDITDRIESATAAENLNDELRVAERMAGMAEVATGVLHNVGNVLNSVNVSANQIRLRIEASELGTMQKVASLLVENQNDLSTFFEDQDRGQSIVEMIDQLTCCFANDHEEQLREAEHLRENISHIKAIVASQQSFARLGSTTETLKPVAIVENAIQLLRTSLSRHNVELSRKFDSVPDVSVQKHDALQILVNLITNAKQATDGLSCNVKTIDIDVYSEDDLVAICIKDSGVGIADENLSRIFQHGFTTKHDGHGIGLHWCALAATKMGGTLSASSDGIGKGAVFTLKLPIAKSEMVY